MKKSVLIVLGMLVWLFPLQAQQVQMKWQKDEAVRARGLQFKYDVKVRAMAKPDLQKYVLKMFSEEMPPEKMFEAKKTFEAFGLIEKSKNLRKVLTNFYANNIAGFYDPGTKKLFIIQPGKGTSPQKAKQNGVVIVHELIHALQDQNFNLFALSKYAGSNDDSASALSGLVEGDATYGMFSRQMAGSLTQQRYFVKFFQLSTDLSKDFMSVNRNVPGVIQDTMMFNYTQGLEFNWKLRNNKGRKGVNQAFSNPPTSTEQILHPEKYFSKFPDNPWQVKLANLDKFFPTAKGWKQVSENTMGELGTLILLREFLAYKNLSSKGGKLWRMVAKNTFLRALGRMAARALSAKKVKKAAEGWGGDRYRVYYNAKQDITSLIWYTYWDTEQDAREFAQAYRKLRRIRRIRLTLKSTSNLVQKGKAVIIMRNVPRRSSVLLLKKLVATKVTPFDTTAFSRKFPICKSVYALRFVDLKDTKKLATLRKVVLGYGKKAVPFLVGALAGEKKKTFLKEVHSLLTKITGKNFATAKEWGQWWKKNGQGSVK